jgi:hypothetical protein
VSSEFVFRTYISQSYNKVFHAEDLIGEKICQVSKT